MSDRASDYRDWSRFGPQLAPIAEGLGRGHEEPAAAMAIAVEAERTLHDGDVRPAVLGLTGMLNLAKATCRPHTDASGSGPGQGASRLSRRSMRRSALNSPTTSVTSARL